MSIPRQLTFFDDPPPFGRPDPHADALRSRSGRHLDPIEYRELAIREILNRCTNPRLPFAWTINPYRGCEFACSYCYARYTHAYLDLERWRDFETRIFVKRGAPAALRRRLKRASLAAEPIAIGTATDPYQPAETRYRVTRSLLRVLCEIDGLELSITTKSPLVVHDLGLLQEVDRRHRLTVHVTLTTVDARLSRRLERNAPDPAARLRTLRALSAAGLRTSVFCMPILPGINDSESALRPLFVAALEAGARDVLPNALFLRPATRACFLPWLRDEFPALVPLYDRLYGSRDYLAAGAQREVLAEFTRLRGEYGCGTSRDEGRECY